MFRSEHGEAEVLAVDHGSPLESAAIDQARKRTPLTRGNGGRPGDLADQSGNINVLYERVFHAAPYATRRTDDQRNANGALVEDHLRQHHVVAEHLPMVGRVDHPRVVEHAAAFERAENFANAFVDHGHIRVVEAAHLADTLLVERVAVPKLLECLDEGAEGAIGRHLRRHEGPQGNAGIPVHRHVFGRRVPRVVGAREPDPLEERLFAVVLVDPARGTAPHPPVDMGLRGEGRRLDVPHGQAIHKTAVDFDLTAAIAADTHPLAVGIV